MSEHQIKFYQTGTFTVGNRLLDPSQRIRTGKYRTLQLPELRPQSLSGLR